MTERIPMKVSNKSGIITRTRLSVSLLILVFLLAACGGTADTTTQGSAKINVVTTIGMIADIVKNVGGEHVEVTQLMGAGVDPHLYTATEGDVNTLLDAQIIFYGGLDLEARMEDIFEQMGESRPTIPVGEAVPAAQRLTKPDTDLTDPHIWMDASLWMLASERVRDELVKLDPANQADYQANAQAYLEKLAVLDEYAREQIASIPEQQRVLVTAHDAFQYFGRAYGIEVFAPQGISTATEAGVEDIRRVVDLVVEREIPAIFVESSVSPDLVEAIQAGAEAQDHEVVIGGQLFSDAMGEAGTPEGTYDGMIRHNVDTIVKALRGEQA
jgi:manganese/zinc/iron transport system substrate-binding protein